MQIACWIRYEPKQKDTITSHQLSYQRRRRQWRWLFVRQGIAGKNEEQNTKCHHLSLRSTNARLLSHRFSLIISTRQFARFFDAENHISPMLKDYWSIVSLIFFIDIHQGRHLISVDLLSDTFYSCWMWSVCICLYVYLSEQSIEKVTVRLVSPVFMHVDTLEQNDERKNERTEGERERERTEERREEKVEWPLRDQSSNTHVYVHTYICQLGSYSFSCPRSQYSSEGRNETIHLATFNGNWTLYTVGFLLTMLPFCLFWR